MNKYAQVFVGGTGKDKIAWQQIKDKLPSAGLSGIIIGWSENSECYTEARKFANAIGAKLYLWLPVFSEMKHFLSQSDFILLTGKPAKSIAFSDDENFDFCCVSDTKNIDKLLEYYNNTFQKYGFDGVFLDRIRYPSFAAGIDAFLGCSCPSCREKYRRFGLSPNDLRDYNERLKSRIRDSSCINPLGIKSYTNGKWMMEDEELELIISAKCDIVYQSLDYISTRLKNNVSEIGLDLFAPFMSEFVGQSYEQLSELADFVKPMLYRYTDTPAGFKYEIRQMVNAISTEDTKLQREGYLKTVLGISEIGNMDGLMISELRNLQKIRDKVMIGIEVHTAVGLPSIRTDQINDNIRTIEKFGFKGITACWNILEAEESKLSKFFGN